MAPSTNPTDAIKRYKKLQSHLYSTFKQMMHCQKTDTVLYHEMLSILARCIAERKASTDPAQVLNLQAIEAQLTTMMKRLEDNMGKMMRMAQSMRLDNASVEKAIERCKRLERMEREFEGSRRSARIKERHGYLAAGKVKR